MVMKVAPKSNHHREASRCLVKNWLIYGISVEWPAAWASEVDVL